MNYLRIRETAGETRCFPVDFLFQNLDFYRRRGRRTVEQFSRHHNRHLRRRSSAQTSSTAAAAAELCWAEPRSHGATERPLGTFSHTHLGIRHPLSGVVSQACSVQAI